MDFNELQELIRILEESGLSEIEIEEDGSRIRLQKEGSSSSVQYAYPPPSAPVPGAPASAAASPETGDAPAEAPPSDGTVTVDSPMVGTFYRAPAPGEPPFVQPGDRVDENQTICIVEAMKLMNEVSVKVNATVEQVLVENGEPVEFGQALFRIRPLDPSEA